MSCQLLDEEYNAGLQDGIGKNLVENVLMFLEERGHISGELREAITSQTDHETLRRWLKLAARVPSVDEFMEKMMDS